MRDLLPSEEPESSFHRVLIAILSDDPYAAVGSIRDAFDEGWLLAHLWDMLWRAGAVGLDTMPNSEMLVRDHLLLQYAKALGACEGLWQLASLYASDLIVRQRPCMQVA